LDNRPVLGGTTFSWVASNLVPLLLVISVVLPAGGSQARALAFIVLAGLLGWLARDLYSEDWGQLRVNIGT
jgi:hypothetical protein